MLKLTKIFHFEMAHAIHGHTGNCKNIHGHSYKLHVTISSGLIEQGFIPAPGFMIDFKEIKKLVSSAVIEKFDHCLLLSRNFIAANPALASLQNLVIFDAEPTAENMLLHIKQVLQDTFPGTIKLMGLQLFETKDSYAEWIDKDFLHNEEQQ